MNNASGVEPRALTPEQVIGSCREWPAGADNRCGKPAEFILWGKLFPPESLGPRCYDHAAKHVHYSALYRGSGYALVHIGELRDAFHAEARDTDE